MLTIGDKIPEINAIIEGNLPFKFPNNEGKTLVLYFYPKHARLYKRGNQLFRTISRF